MVGFFLFVSREKYLQTYNNVFVFAGRLGKIFVDTLPSDIRHHHRRRYAHGLSRIHIFWGIHITLGHDYDDVYTRHRG